jgi:hypothetical protein
MLYSITASFTEAQIENISNYRKLLSRNIETSSIVIKTSDSKTIRTLIKNLKRREKCCTLFLAYIRGLSPYDKKFSGFPKELELEIEMIAILCENEIGI